MKPKNDKKSNLPAWIQAVMDAFAGNWPKRKTQSLLMAVIFIIVGAVIRPFIESFFKQAGENFANKVIPHNGMVTNLGPSQVSRATYKVSIVNHTTSISDQEVGHVAQALEKQIHNDLAPIWGVDAEITVVKQGEAPVPGQWWVELLDETDSTQAISYHDVTTDKLPRSKIFVKTAKNNGINWTVSASHELISMLVDPRTDLMVVPNWDNIERIYALEIAAPVETETYQIDGVTISDFVFPAWFDATRPAGSTQFDFLDHVHRPLELKGHAVTLGPNLKDGFHFLTGSQESH
jgi:hypothetical protein